MKICVISTPIFQLGNAGLKGYGGLEQIAWQCAAGLAKLGHQVGLVAPSGSKCPGVTIHETGPAGLLPEDKCFGGFKGLVPNQFGQQVQVEIGSYWQHLFNYDAIIDHSWQKWSVQLKAEGRLQAPILGVCHAPVDTMFKELPPKGQCNFVCISDDQRVHFENLYARPARTCYNGVDLSFYKPLGLKRSNRFLFLARFSTIKGPDLAIEACLKAGVGLDLVGDTTITNEPELFKRCMAMAASAPEGQIQVHGNAPRGECVWWMGQAHALLHPNERFREPFGLAPVEALACGCPVIAWDNGAMRETLCPEVGMLVKSFDDLVTGIKALNVHVLENTRQACVERAQKFSVENMARRYHDLCVEAVQTGGWG